MIRDILTLRSDKNFVIEYLSEDRIRVMGDDVNVKTSKRGVESIHYLNGPRFKPGQVSNFRGQDRMVTEIQIEDRKGSTVMALLDLEDVRV